jgi:hypothetical protein
MSGALITAHTYLETRRTPVDELNGSLSSDIGHSGVDVLRHNVTTVEQTTSHVFSLSWVTLDHLVVGFEARNGHLRHRVGLVER